MARRISKDDDIQRIRLTRKQFKELVEKENGVLDPVFTQKYLNDTYFLGNGQVVVNFDTHGFLYSSVSDLRKWLKVLEKRRNDSFPSHILKHRLLYGEEFLLHRTALVEGIVSLFSLEESMPSSGELKSIDRQLMKKSTEITPSLFSGLVAYAGEVIMNSLKQGEWSLLTSPFDTTVYEPYIIAGGKTYNPFFPVYKELYEEYPETNRLSLADALHIEMGRPGK